MFSDAASSTQNFSHFEVGLSFGGSVIEVVEQWPHLGHIITNRCTDDAEIMNRRHSMIGQINNVLCYFGKLPSQVKSRLLYAYCSSLYGCDLWDLWNSNIVCVLLGEKHYEECGICHLIHIVIFCLDYLMHYLCIMQSVNVCCLLFQSV